MAGQIKSEDGDTVTCQRLDTMETVTLPAENVQKANPPKFKQVLRKRQRLCKRRGTFCPIKTLSPIPAPLHAQAEDMAELVVLNEASVLYNLKDRYMADLIYVRCAPSPWWCAADLDAVAHFPSQILPSPLDLLGPVLRRHQPLQADPHLH